MRVGVLRGLALAALLAVAAVRPTTRRADEGQPRAGEALATPAPWAPPGGPAAAPDDGPPYDGRFTFVRIRWEAGGGGQGLRGFGRYGRGRGGGEALWEHDMRRGAERHFAKILDEMTFVGPSLEGRVLTFDDPELFRYPVSYIVEVGYWRPTEAEVEGLRAYLLKGGFLIVDDFRGWGALANFEEQMQRVLPGTRLLQVEARHPIFDSFFHIPDPLSMIPAYGDEPPVYLGIFEDNDVEGRLMAIVNYNNDLGEYWEFSDVGYYPIDLSNEAYKFGVNYVVYAMTH